MTARRIPLNTFGVAFGLAGLGETWGAAAQAGHAPEEVGQALLALSALIWLLTLVAYAYFVLGTRGAFAADLRDNVASPFASLALITPMLLAAEGLTPYDPGAAKVLVDVFLVLTLLLGGWLTGQWIYGDVAMESLHPGYFLPTVAGGLIASASAAEVQQQWLAEIMLGLGLVCWFVLGSIIMTRLFFRPLPPPALLPTLAIEVAPAPVASLAYLAVNGGRMDAVAAGLAGYGLLMVVAQLRLVPVYLRLRFTPGFWAFTFSWAAVATVTLRWIEFGSPPGLLVYTYLVLAAVTVLIGGILARSLLAAARHEFLPARTPSGPAE